MQTYPQIIMKYGELREKITNLKEQI